MFKLIPTYPDYAVSDEGVVINVKHGYEIKQQIDDKGYYRAFLTKNRKLKYYRTHRLVIWAFLGIVSTYERCINHKDCNKLNNNLSNLEVISQQQNREHAKINGRYKNAIEAMKKSHKRQRKLTDDQVRDIRMNYRHKTVPYRHFADKYNVSRNVVAGVFNNNYKDIA